MKKEEPAKYVHSANLFLFCRRVLDQKFGGVRVIDQDVGQILGFDPADCSHWKKGKKNIRSIHAMRAIAEYLQVDERLVIDVATGELTDQEAFLEHNGHLHVRIDPKFIDNVKKEYYRRGELPQSGNLDQWLREAFSVDDARIEAVVQDILTQINFKEAPVYLPEILTAFPELTLEAIPGDAIAVHVVRQDGRYLIRYSGGDKMRPFLRHQIAKAMAPYFLERAGFEEPNLMPEHAKLIKDVRDNIFAGKLLAPSSNLRKALDDINISRDVITQLAEVFWVSKTFINVRLKDLLQNPL